MLWKGSLIGKAVVLKTTGLVPCRFDSCPFRQEYFRFQIADFRLVLTRACPNLKSAIFNQKYSLGCRLTGKPPASKTGFLGSNPGIPAKNIADCRLVIASVPKVFQSEI